MADFSFRISLFLHSNISKKGCYVFTLNQIVVARRRYRVTPPASPPFYRCINKSDACHRLPSLIIIIVFLFLVVHACFFLLQVRYVVCVVFVKIVRLAFL
jgi:hypothetical protein